MPSMPTVAGYKTKLYVDGINLSGQSSGATLTSDVSVQEYDIMDNPVKQAGPAAPAFSIAQNGYYTGHGAEYIEQELKARLGTTAVVRVALLLDTIYYALESTWNSQMRINGQVEDLITVEANWSNARKGYRGKKVDAASRADGWTSPSVDMGAAFPAGTVMLSAAGFSDLTGVSGNVTVILETATTEGGVYSLLKQQQFVAPGAVIVTHTGGSRWVRLRVTTTNYAGQADVFGGVTLQAS